MKFSFPRKSVVLLSTLALASSGASPASAEDNDSISIQTVQQIVDQNTLSPATAAGHKWVNTNHNINVQKIGEERYVNQIVSEQGEISTTSGE
ncbi:hypothetical protein [Corynebacterium sp.]|uniref:hypothetical protein n=1 Tax=Corynebacterium sp. TaxID=1720 RepID=UPI0026DCD66E|nr:hypothetical protein [Corynebacterium sp.]MDO5032078.1 hypothetical protein [Corynebacterium sp.]